MVEVTLNSYIFVHRRHRTDPTPLAGSYMPALPTCTVASAPQASCKYLPKKTRVGLHLDLGLEKDKGGFWTCDFSATSTMD